jgi:hypothetical protein
MKYWKSVLALSILPVGHAWSDAGKGAQAPGTYEILVCKATCSFADSRNVVVKGVLVLAPTALEPDFVSQLEDMDFDVADTRRGDPNACFVLDTIDVDWTLAGIDPFGLTVWSLDRKKLHFSLYGSPDAFHVVSAKLTSDGFSGHGGDAGYGSLEPDERSDFIIARKTGPPDLQTCITAASARGR